MKRKIALLLLMTSFVFSSKCKAESCWISRGYMIVPAEIVATTLSTGTNVSISCPAWGIYYVVCIASTYTGTTAYERACECYNEDNNIPDALGIHYVGLLQ